MMNLNTTTKKSLLKQSQKTSSKVGTTQVRAELDEPNLVKNARSALQQAIDCALKHQQEDGHWVAPISTDVSFTAEYVMFKYAMQGLSLEKDGDDLRSWILATQLDNGSWALGPGLSGDLSSSVESYLALRLLDVPASDPAMQKARSFVLARGGIAGVRFFTRFFLASFGLFPWSAVPQMQPEVILMPTWAPLNIYVLSSWARSTLIPMILVRHHAPVYRLPNGQSANNDFLDELWCDPTEKKVPYAPPILELFWGKDRQHLKLTFTLVDKFIAGFGGLRRTQLHKLAYRRCLDWILEHQEEQGDWAGYFPPVHLDLWVLLLEGYSLDDRRIRLGLEALERFSFHDEKGKQLQATVSPCWDTALMANALCDAGLSGEKSVLRAIEWLKPRQLMVDHGDWRIYANTQQAGGWCFEYFNTFFPDVDDTAVVIMTLVKQDSHCINSERISNAIEWILGMQNDNGGWGSFDVNNEAVWLHAVPFNDTDALVDPATSDVTGRVLECWGLLLTYHATDCRLLQSLRERLGLSARKAIPFLLAQQEISGAWWGRWGCNYIYGTANVLRGLQSFCCANVEVQKAIGRGIQWLKSFQQLDGGWGETLFSYTDARLAGCGTTTAAQTAWAVDILLRFTTVSDSAVESGISWLVMKQTSRNKDHRQWASWPTTESTGTGFPQNMFIGYPFYHQYFPIAALSRYLDKVRTETSITNSAIGKRMIASDAVCEVQENRIGRTSDDMHGFIRGRQQRYHCHNYRHRGNNQTPITDFKAYLWRQQAGFTADENEEEITNILHGPTSTRVRCKFLLAIYSHICKASNKEQIITLFNSMDVKIVAALGDSLLTEGWHIHVLAESKTGRLGCRDMKRFDITHHDPHIRQVKPIPEKANNFDIESLLGNALMAEINQHRPLAEHECLVGKPGPVAIYTDCYEGFWIAQANTNKSSYSRVLLRQIPTCFIVLSKTMQLSVLAAVKRDADWEYIDIRDVYDAQQRQRRGQLSDRTLAQLLLDRLVKQQWFFPYDNDRVGYLVDLLYKHLYAIGIYRKNHHVFFLNYTYKTKDFSVLPMNIVAGTSINIFLRATVSYTSSKEKSACQWVIKCLQELQTQFTIPHLLVLLTGQELAPDNALEDVYLYSLTLLCQCCVFKIVGSHLGSYGGPEHRDMRIQELKKSRCVKFSRKNASEAFQTFIRAFSQCLLARSEEKFKESRQKLYELNDAMASYVDSQYLKLSRNELVARRLDNYLYFSDVATLIAEPSHRYMKSWLNTLTADTFTC